VHQFELLPEPPKDRPPLTWPNWPMILRTSSSHEEGVARDWSINTKAFLGDAKGNLRAIRGVRLEWAQDNGRPVMKEIPGSEFELPCELVLLALGFLGPETTTITSQLGCALTERGNLQAGPDYQTTTPGVFACGDARRGQSLVVWAIWEGRECARGVDAYLMGQTWLPASPEL
jgi:glutamate synthase (NADPH/NADH) small chain